VPDLLAIIEPYLALLESDGLEPAPAAAPAPAKGGRPPKQKHGRGKGGKGGKGASDGRGRGGAGGGRGAARASAGRGASHAARTIKLPAFEAEGEEEDEGEEEEGAPPAAAPAAAPVPTYREKVVVMFLSLSAHWLFTHSVNERKSSEILPAERTELAREAYTLGVDVVQAVVAVCGDEARQTYLHDIVYGLQKLFLILGKPYLGATEGNEHAHQEMKKDFHAMCSHSNKAAGSMLQLMNLHYLRRNVYSRHATFAPPTKESESTLAMDLHRKESKRHKKAHDDAIPIANAALKAAKTPEEPPIEGR